jgi:hypothetical protein
MIKFGKRHFMDILIKKELHELIDKCDNESVLDEVKALLESDKVVDWWDELSEIDKNLVKESDADMAKKIISARSSL